MPDQLKGDLAEAAAVSGRSLHAELLHRLQASLTSPISEMQLAKLQLQKAHLEAELDLVKLEAVALGFAVKAFLIAMRDDLDKLQRTKEELDDIERAADEAIAYEKLIDVNAKLNAMRSFASRAEELASTYKTPVQQNAESALRFLESKAPRKRRIQPG